MKLSTPHVIAGGALLALCLYLFWYMSPYEQCVRAKTESGARVMMTHRDDVVRQFGYDADTKSDETILAEQEANAKAVCAGVSD